MRKYETVARGIGLTFAVSTAACSGIDSSTALGGDGAGTGAASAGVDDSAGDTVEYGTTGAGGESGLDDGAEAGGETGDAGPACDGDGGCARCDVSEQAWDSECVPCISTKGDYDLAITKVDIVGTLTFNGTPGPASDADDGNVWLRNSEGDLIRIGNTHDATLGATIIPGIYDVVFAAESGGEFTADNAAAVVARDVVFDDAAPFEIDVATTVVTGEFRFDGVAAPPVSSESGRVWLRTPGGDEIHLGTTDRSTFWVNVVPGVYEVHYEAVAGGAIAPRNPHAVLTNPVEITASPDGSSQIVDIDIPTAVWTGTITLDGDTPPSVSSENGQLWARDLLTEREVKIGETRDGEFYARLVVGSYELYYSHAAGGAAVPVNEHARVAGPMSLTQDVDEGLELTTAVIAGQFFGDDGDVPPPDPTDDGLVSLRETTTGDSVRLGNTAAGGFAGVRLLAGEYAIRYSQDTSRGGVPANTNAELGAAAIDGGTTTLDVIIPSVALTGSIKLGGAPPPASDYNDGRVYLRNRTTGDSVLLASTRTASYAATVVPGTYDVVYVVETVGGSVPVNNEAVISEAVEIPANGPATLDIDIPVLQLRGRIAVAEGSIEPRPGEVARIYATDVRTRDRVYVGSTAARDYAQSLTPGRYVLTYSAQLAEGGIPQNSNAALGCIDLAE